MSNDITYIPIEKIKNEKNPTVSEAYLKRMINYKDDLYIYDLLLPVEKYPNEDQYLLVGGFDRFDFMSLTGYKYAPCTTEPYLINESKRNEKILRRLHNNGDSSKENRQSILVHFNVNTIDSILFKIGITKTEFMQNYCYNPNIPIKYINKHTSYKTMNWIYDSAFNMIVKAFLYERAGLPKGNPERFTFKDMDLVRKLLKNDIKLYYIQPNLQIKVLTRTINSNSMTIDILKTMVNEYYEYPKLIKK
jgi:hypothetical protein